MYIYKNKIQKAIIFSDSQSAIRALSAQSREHPILVDILEINHKCVDRGLKCIFVWNPGHSGILGKERADPWARMAHQKPNLTRIKVGHQELYRRVKGNNPPSSFFSKALSIIFTIQFFILFSETLIISQTKSWVSQNNRKVKKRV